jgi:hypothetical protein
VCATTISCWFHPLTRDPETVGSAATKHYKNSAVWFLTLWKRSTKLNQRNCLSSIHRCVLQSWQPLHLNRNPPASDWC